MNLPGTTLALGAVLLLAACSSAPVVRDDYPLPPEVVETPAAPADGSIFHTGRNVALFEDSKARQVGDILTVLLVEKTDAKKSANTSTSKDSSVGVTSPTIAGRPVTAGGTEILNFDLGSEQAFAGGGDSTQSNALTGALSVVVTRVLPNGNMVVRGQKQIELNQGREMVSVEGIVRPVDIQPGNTVTSDRVANARIRYGGRGVIEDANSMGWLARFFNSAFFPF